MTTLSFRRAQQEKIGDEQYGLLVIQHTAMKSGNQQVMQRILKQKMNKVRLICTAVSKPDDIMGTVAHYPHMEERQAKNGQIWLHQKFCQDLEKKKTYTEMETVTLPAKKKK